MSDSTTDRALTCATVLLEAAQERGFWISGDNRITLESAAALVGIEVASLRNAISEGRGPPVYALGNGTAKRTVRLLDLGAWIESRRE